MDTALAIAPTVMGNSLFPVFLPVIRHLVESMAGDWLPFVLLAAVFPPAVSDRPSLLLPNKLTAKKKLFSTKEISR